MEFRHRKLKLKDHVLKKMHPSLLGRKLTAQPLTVKLRKKHTLEEKRYSIETEKLN